MEQSSIRAHVGQSKNLHPDTGNIQVRTPSQCLEVDNRDIDQLLDL